MSEVVSLRGAVIRSERREAFLQTVAQAFDRYVADQGCEPEAIVYTLCGITQSSQTGWDVQGVSQEGMASILSLAAVHMLAEAQSTRQGLS